MTGVSFAAKALRVRPGEGAMLFAAFTFHFLLLASYYVLRALRDEIGATHTDLLSTLWTVVFFATLVAVPLFWIVVSVWPRRFALPIIYLFFTSNILLFYPLLRLPPGQGLVLAECTFYVWTSVFALLSVSVFWALMADVYQSEQGKRLFGVIAAGGSLGGVVGPALATLLLKSEVREHLLLLSGGLLAAGTFCLWRLNTMTSDAASPLRVATSENALPNDRPRSAILSGLKTIVRSPYLLGICAFLFLHSLGSTFLYFEKLHLVKTAIVDRARRAAFFAEVDLLVNATTVLIQALLLSRLLARIGVGTTLLARPAVTLIGFATLGIALVVTSEQTEGVATNVFGVLVAFEVVRRGVNFALAKPTREILFTVVDRDTKYKSKAFIDTVVYRGSDVACAWFFSGLRALGLGLGAIALIAAPFATLGMVIAIALGRRQAQLATAETSEPTAQRKENEYGNNA